MIWFLNYRRLGLTRTSQHKKSILTHLLTKAKNRHFKNSLAKVAKITQSKIWTTLWIALNKPTELQARLTNNLMIKCQRFQIRIHKLHLVKEISTSLNLKVDSLQQGRSNQVNQWWRNPCNNLSTIQNQLKKRCLRSCRGSMWVLCQKFNPIIDRWEVLNSADNQKNKLLQRSTPYLIQTQVQTAFKRSTIR